MSILNIYTFFVVLTFVNICSASVDGFVGFDGAHEMPFGRSDMTATLVEVDGEPRIYLIGGCIADQECPTNMDWCFCPEITNKCEYYVPDEDSWHACANAPNERYRFAASHINGKLYVAGGRDLTGDYADNLVDAVDVYDIATDSWSTPYTWVNATSDNGMFVDGDDLYLVGGYNIDYSVATSRVQRLSTIDWQIEDVEPLAVGRGDIGVISVPQGDDVIHYAIGGAGFDFCRMLSTVESYDVASDTWTTLANMSVARADKALGFIDESLFVIAGESKDENCGSIPVVDVERFDPDDGIGEWVVEEDVPSSRFRFVGTSYSDKIYLFGGQSELIIPDDTAISPHYRILNTTMVYQPKSVRDRIKLAPSQIAGIAVAGIVVGGIVVVVVMYLAGRKYAGYSKADAGDADESKDKDVAMKSTEQSTTQADETDALQSGDNI